MIKVVIDTNTIISSLWGGKPGKVITLWKAREVRLLISEEILKEYLRVLARFKLTDKDLKAWASFFTDPGRVEKISPVKHFEIIKEDTSDNKFLDCAVTGKAEYIISGDKHLCNLKEFKGIPILNADKFLKIYQKDKK